MPPPSTEHHFTHQVSRRDRSSAVVVVEVIDTSDEGEEDAEAEAEAEAEAVAKAALNRTSFMVSAAVLYLFVGNF